MAADQVKGDPSTTATVDATSTVKDFSFEPPKLLATSEGPIRVESPGYACPCWADVDGDGAKELLVGQFRDGKIRVYQHLGELKFAPGEWLQAGGAVAHVPGVW